MKREARSQTSLVLMVVGIIFIVIAGTVFVSTAWRYLPPIGKQGILFLGTILLFIGANRMAGSGWMEKTEAALYYLGTACMGLFTLSVWGEWMSTEGENIRKGVIGWNTEAILAASMIMLLPVVFRFLKKRTAFDFILMALLADWILFWFQVTERYEWFGGCVISAIGLTAYALADYFRERWIRGNGKVELAFIVLYILHGIRFVVSNLTLPWVEDSIQFYLGLFLMGLFTAGITTLMQLTRNHGIFRVFNSIAVYWSLIHGANLVYELLADQASYPWNGEIQHFLMFSLCALCMVVLARKEMVVMTAVWGGLIPFGQIWIYGDYHVWFSYVSHRVSAYVPFSGVLILTMGFLIFRKVREGRLDREQILRYVRALAVQGMIMLILIYASQYPFLEKGMYSMLMLQSFAIASLYKHWIVKRCFQSFALFFGEILLAICTQGMVSADYEVERFCLLAAAGILLMGFIWNRYGSLVRNIQFVCVCLLMLILLGNAMAENAVGHALVLGVAGVSMLLCASFWNSRRYAVLSSSVLVILVFYITRSFWCSMEWWVYLFAAGVALVVLAIRKERASAKRWHSE